VPSGGRFDTKKRNNEPIQQQQESDQELEETALEGKEPEYARQQNQIGNQAVSSIIAGKAGQSGSSDGPAGVDVAHALAQEEEQEKQSAEFGGDDEPADPGPLTINHSAFSKNPSLKKFKDKKALREYMPDDRLPEPDPAFEDAATHAFQGATVPKTDTLDSHLQPSRVVIASSLAAWSDGVTYWTGETLAERCIAQFVKHPPPCIQDRHGRVLHSRTRVASAALALLCSSPTVRQPADDFTCSFINYCLELAGRSRTLEEFRIMTLSDKQVRLPVAEKLLKPHLIGNTYQREARPLSDGARNSLAYFLEGLLDPWDPDSFLPNYVSLNNPAEEIDDPLNLDAIMDEMLGPARDRDEFVAETALTTAENLATECARLRIQVAGIAIVIGDLSELWLPGSPDEMLLRCAAKVDISVRDALKLLVDIAGAAKRQEVTAKGLENGLRHAASRVRQVTTVAIEHFIEAIATVLSGDPTLVTKPSAIEDQLSNAWGDNRPAEGLEWLATQPPTLDTQLAVLLTRADMGLSAPGLLTEALQVRQAAKEQGSYLHGHIATLIATNGYLQGGQPTEALTLARELREEAWSRRNGLGVATAAMYELEALADLGESEQLQATHLAAGQDVWKLGADAALSLLARWQPVTEEE
jgi:hypothetical protein